MKSCFAIACLLTVSLLCAEAQPLAPDAFAYGMRLEAERAAPIQSALLPLEVYRTVTRADLGDVRVFNGSGEELPHAVYRGGVSEAPAPTHALPFFPLRGASSDAAGSLRLQIRPAPDGALVQVDRRPGRADDPVRALVVDASRLTSDVRRLVFTWPDTVSFIADVVVETSDDLATWEPWGEPATLAHLRYGGETLRRDELALPPRRARYVRLSWSAGAMVPLPVRLVAVEAVAAVPERRWVSIEPASSSPGAYVFDQAGVLPVEQVRVALPQPNTLARVVLASAASDAGPWRERYRGLLYRLHVDGRDLTTPPVDVARSTDRFWRLQVDAAGGGLGQGRPVLELGWTPERLLFVARGAPPYTLAFGSAGVVPSSFDPGELLRLLPGRPDEHLAAASVTAGPVFELGGGARLHPQTAPAWDQIVLWAVLILGVVLLAVMSIRLLRQVDRDRRAAGP